MDTDYLLVLCTCPSRSAADAIATAALEERLAACVNQVPGIRSLYRWKGRVESDDEILLLIKTTTASFSRLEATIRSLHPHELPEIIAVPINTGQTDYIKWITSCLK